jgi:putative ABC transport system permease protein
MFLALKEMRRAKVRFGLLIAAVALLVFLILFQQSLQNGLLRSFVGAIENQSAPVLVYAVDGQKVLQASIITPELEAKIAAVDGVGRTGALTQGSFSASVGRTQGDVPNGQPQRLYAELVDVAVLGYEVEGVGSPALSDGRLPSGPGEVAASDVDAESGFGLGDTVRIEPGGLVLTVVGLASEAQLNAGPTMFATMETYADVLAARNPDATGRPLPNAIGVEPAAGVTPQQLVARINAASDDLDALTREDAAAQTPGVAQVRSSFLVIFLLYGIVVPLVIGLFFLIVTFQKSGSLTLLRAIGASGRKLVSSLLVQVVIVLGLGYLVGVALYTPISKQRLGTIPLQFETKGVIVWAILLMTLGVLASMVSARRVLAIDPIEATTGAGGVR